MQDRHLLSVTLGLLMLISGAGIQQCHAQSPTPSQQAGSSGGGNNATQTNVASATDLAYQDLRSMWDRCNNLKSTALDLLDEGRSAPSRQKWVSYYVSSAKDDVAALKKESAAMHFPDAYASAVAASWTQAQSAIQSLDGIVAKIDTEAQGMKSPTDDKFPPVFWAPSKDFSKAAEDLDKTIISIFSTLDSNVSKANPDLSSKLAKNGISSTAGSSGSSNADNSSSTQLKGGTRMVESSAGFKKIGEASTKISKACWGLFGELERWNLLYGKPPASGIGDGFYGGGLTSQEIGSEYKYLPQFVFTSPAYIMLYSYRLPPRQNMLAYHTTQIGKLLNLMDIELNDVQIPADRQQALAGPWEETKKLYVDCRNQYLNLYNLVNNTTDERLAKNIRDDQSTFGQPIMAIYSDMSKLRSSLTDINQIIK